MERAGHGDPVPAEYPAHCLPVQRDETETSADATVVHKAVGPPRQDVASERAGLVSSWVNMALLDVSGRLVQSLRPQLGSGVSGTLGSRAVDSPGADEGSEFPSTTSRMPMPSMNALDLRLPN